MISILLENGDNMQIYESKSHSSLAKSVLTYNYKNVVELIEGPNISKASEIFKVAYIIGLVQCEGDSSTTESLHNLSKITFQVFKKQTLSNI